MKQQRLWLKLALEAIATALIALSLFAWVVHCSSRPIRITIVSDPPGASVFGTNQYLGHAPVTLLFEPGEERPLSLIRRHCKDRKILIRSNDYLPKTPIEKWHHLLYGREVTASPVRMKTTLTASLSVTTSPKGTEVYLDGRRLGLAPLHRTGLIPGTHVLRVVSSDFYPKEQQIKLIPGQETVAAVTLENKWTVFYQNRIAKTPGVLTNYAELAHEYIMRGKWTEAEKILRDGFAMVSQPGATDQSRYFEHLRRTYTRYYLYPTEGADESLRPACKEIVEQALKNEAYNVKMLQQCMKSINAYDKKHPPKKK